MFGAGTVYWAWGLDDNHDLEQTPVDPNVQQAMVNLFADMGVQPDTLMASLVLASQSTDHTAPTSTVTTPGVRQTLPAYSPITITGTADDAGGGTLRSSRYRPTTAPPGIAPTGSRTGPIHGRP